MSGRRGLIMIGLWLCVSGVLASTVSFAPATPGTSQFAVQMTAVSLAECPEQGGILDSISVPKSEARSFVVIISEPAPEGGRLVEVRSGDPELVSVGDPREAFLPFVTIPEGEIVSSPFLLFGLEVGETNLRAYQVLPAPGFLAFDVPLGAWDVGDPGEDGEINRFLDSNAVALSEDQNDGRRHCRTADDEPELATDEAELVDCGVPVDGIVTDGVSRLLLRTRAGLEGTACFEIAAADPDDGEIAADPVKLTQPVALPDGEELQQASAYYLAPDSFLSGEPNRPVRFVFSFTPAEGNGNTTRIEAEATLVRPPVVLVHGLWSNQQAWKDDFWLRNDEYHTTVKADYEATNDSSFQTNLRVIQDSALAAIAASEEKGYATTQADVIGHSMGGNLARLFASSQNPNYRRPDNLGEGDIRRLITLATPHLGSSFANLVVAFLDVNPDMTITTISDLITAEDPDPRRGAICDLAENSPGILQLEDGTELPAHVVTATGGPAGSLEQPANYWQGFLVLGNFEKALTRTECVDQVFAGPGVGYVCTEFEPVFPAETVDGHRFLQANDAIVPLTSAGAVLPAASAARRNFDIVHFGVAAKEFVLVKGPTNVPEIAEHSLSVLDLSVEAGAWATAFPPIPPRPPSPLPDADVPAVDGSGAPWTVPGVPGGSAANAQVFLARCGGGTGTTGQGDAEDQTEFEVLNQQSGDPRVQIVEPTQDQVFAPGDMVDVVLEVDPSLSLTDAMIGLRPGGGAFDLHTFDLQVWTTAFEIPPGTAGALRLAPRVRTAEGEWIFGPERRFVVVPEEMPESISAGNPRHRLDLNAEETARIGVQGRYAGGITRILTEGVTGTTYTSNNPQVAEVDGDGRVTPVGVGTAAITVEHRGLTDFVAIIVTDGRRRLPPIDVTDEVRIVRSGFRLNRNTGFFIQRVRIDNPGPVPVIGPLNAFVMDLSEGVRPIGFSVTQRMEPVGTRFYRLKLPTDRLNLYPGEAVERTLQFLNRDRVGIDYRLEVKRTLMDI